MLGCSFGNMFQVTVAGGSYQDGLTSVVQGCPPGIRLTEKELYGDMLLRKPGSDELSSPRKEPDLPVIFSGQNAEDTVPEAENKGLTNGTPLSILIPNLDRHFVHIKQYQDTNRTPRPGHASYASFQKYGANDDAIGAGMFSGRYTSTIVAAGYVAKKVLKQHGVDVFSYVEETADVKCPNMDLDQIQEITDTYKQMRHDYDPFYQEIYEKGRIKPEMRFLEKINILSEIENEIDSIRGKAPEMKENEVRRNYGVHPILLCPDMDAADRMVETCRDISEGGDSAGGLVKVVVRGAPAGIGEPVFRKLDGELGRLLGIGAVKAVESGTGIDVKGMTGSQFNDQLRSEDGQITFSSNNAGGITGGLSTGQDIEVGLAIKPTPTIGKKQTTVDKYTGEERELAAITRRDPTIVGRIWPVAENFTALVLLDLLMLNTGYQSFFNA